MNVAIRFVFAAVVSPILIMFPYYTDNSRNEHKCILSELMRCVYPTPPLPHTAQLCTMPSALSERSAARPTRTRSLSAQEAHLVADIIATT